MLPAARPGAGASADLLRSGAMRANDPQALAASRMADKDRLEHQHDADVALAMIPREGFVPGEPGRRYLDRSAAANAYTDSQDLSRVTSDLAEDPNTGTAEQARVGKIRGTLDDAATTMRPEVGDAARTVAERNAFAEYMKAHGLALGKSMGELEAQGSPAAYAAGMTPVNIAHSSESQENLDATNRRAMQLETVKGQAKGMKLSAAEQAQADAAATADELAPQLMDLMEQDNPGISADPSKFAGWDNVLGERLGGWLYKQGKVDTPNSDRIKQLTGYLEAALPRMVTANRLNQNQYNDLKLHVPQVGLSDGANYLRLKHIMDTIMPAVRHGIEAGHSQTPLSPITRPAAVDPRSVPPGEGDYMSEAEIRTRARALRR
jgi:hypothetical protein